ncbi:hypothetical protein QA599_15055 [Haloarculaceae archaeon H-GB1-1]|nr:hypothetical protein [Haloarculaceae archaeon H-GB1-1]
MVDLEPEWLPSTKLNAIGRAVDFSDADPLPPNITRDEVEEYCYTLRQMYKTYVDELVAETELSRREAQTWALRNLVFDEGERLTYEAIGLYIWAIGRATDGDPLSRTIVSDYHERAERKIDRAEATVKRTGPPPYPDDLYDDPTLLWVDQPVGERLQRRLDPEETFSDCIERLLDETSDALSLAAFVDAYRGRGSEYVALDTVYPTWDRTLRFVVHLPESESTPPAVAEATAVTVDGHPYEFAVTERPTADRGRAHVPVLATDGDGPAVAPDDGRERLRTALATAELGIDDLVDDLADAGCVALAVGEEPVGNGAALTVASPADHDAVDRRLRPLDRLALDDRTIAVASVTVVSPGEFAAEDATLRVLWGRADCEDVPTVALPDDPVELRERVPTPVLRTN